MFLSKGCGCLVYGIAATLVLMMIAPFLHPYVAMGIVTSITLILLVVVLHRAAKNTRGFTYYEGTRQPRNRRQQRNLAGRDVQAMNRVRRGYGGFFDYNRTARAARKVNRRRG